MPPTTPHGFTAFDEEGRIIETTQADLASEIDTVAEELCEEFDLNPGQAEGIVEWHLARVDAETLEKVALRVGRVVGWLMRPGNVNVRVHGLAHALRLNALSGIRNLRASAKECGCTVANVSKYRVEAIELLELGDSFYGKSPEARAKYAAIQTGENHWTAKQREERIDTALAKTPSQTST